MKQDYTVHHGLVSLFSDDHGPAQGDTCNEWAAPQADTPTAASNIPERTGTPAASRAGSSGYC